MYGQAYQRNSNPPGKDAIRFIKRMHEVETSSPSKSDGEMMKRLKEKTLYFEKMLSQKNKK